MSNIEFLGLSWNPFAFWWTLSLLGMSILGLTGLGLNRAVREAKKQKLPKGAPKGGVDVRDAQSALYSLAYSLPLMCAFVFIFMVPVVNAQAILGNVSLSIVYGFFRECWRRASEIDWRAKYPPSRLSVTGRILQDSMDCFIIAITVSLIIQFVLPH